MENEPQADGKVLAVDPTYVEKIIAIYRDVMSEDDSELLFGLHEANGDFEVFAAELDTDSGDLYEKYIDVLKKVGEVKEKRLRQGGGAWRTGLRSEDLKVILDTYDLTDDEKRILEARIAAPNQTVAALALQMSGSAYVEKYRAIRDRHGF